MMTAPTTVRRRSALVLLAVVSVVLFVVLYLLAVRTAWGQRADNAAIRGRTIDSAVQHAVRSTLDTVSVTSATLATFAVMGAALLRRRPRLAIGAGALVLGANATTQVLKNALDRPGLLGPGVARATVSTFPSGHSTVAMSLALALVLVVPARLRVAVGVASGVFAVVVGAATLTGAWHRPSDVLAAYLVTLIWAAGVSAWLVVPRAATRGGAVPADRTPPALDWIVFALVFLVIAAAIAMGVDVLRDAELDQIGVGRAYVFAVLAIAAGTFAALAALILTLDRAPLDPPRR
jgi:membrane-associated phospholipid phosphatase